MAVLEVPVTGRLVFARIVSVDAADPDQSTTPTADNQRAVLFADRKSDTDEEVRAVETLGFPLHFKILSREILAELVDAGHGLAGHEYQNAVLDLHGALPTKVRFLPTLEPRFRQDFLPLDFGVGLRSLLGLLSDRNPVGNQDQASGAD